MTPQECVKTAVWLAENGYVNMAVQKCEEALRQNEFYSPAHWSRCFLKMLQGDLSEWAKYEWYDDPRYTPQKGWFKRRVNRPLWDGSPLNGKRIFLYCDEGYGDFFQFVRYAKLIQQQGGYTIVECHPATEGVIRTCDGVDEIVKLGDKIEFDLHCPFMLAPKYFDIANYIPSETYLSLPETHNDHLNLYLSMPSQPSIGVVWKGNPKHTRDLDRSVDPGMFKRLVTNRQLVSLQQGCYEDGFLNAGMMLQDWTDTACLISKMDLVISVDTAVAHLAGAMGKEVWMILANYPDWRWGLEKNHTPWYPSMRLFRKTSSWEALFDIISSQL